MAQDEQNVLQAGLTRETMFTVEGTHTAGHLGSGDVRVLATPMMILFMEINARSLLAGHLPAGMASVGTRVDVRHLAACPVGAEVRVRAEIKVLRGSRVLFRVEALHGAERLGKGWHWRRILDESRFLRRFEGEAG